MPPSTLLCPIRTTAVPKLHNFQPREELASCKYDKYSRLGYTRVHASRMDHTHVFSCWIVLRSLSCARLSVPPEVQYVGRTTGSPIRRRWAYHRKSNMSVPEVLMKPVVTAREPRPVIQLQTALGAPQLS